MKKKQILCAIVTLTLFVYAPFLCMAVDVGGSLEQPVTFNSSWDDCVMEYDSSPAALNGGYEPSEDEHCEVVVSGGDLLVTHIDSVFNCCIDEIAVKVDVSKGVITVSEYEVFTMPCYCYCYFDVYTEIHNLAPGDYDIEVWTHWADGDSDLRCQETVSIPYPLHRARPIR